MFWRTKAGSTSVMIPGRATNTSGAGMAIAYNTSGLAASYRREGSSSFTTINLASATAGTFTSSGLAVPSGGVTGAFEIHPPNAAFAAGAKWVEIQLSGATGMQDLAWFVALDAVDYQYTDTLLSSTYDSSGYYSATTTQYAFTAGGTVPSAHAVTGGLKGRLFSIVSGTGAGQDRIISASSVSVGVVILTFETAFEVTPDATSVWVIRRSRLPVLDSSLRVKANVEQAAGQTVSATSPVDFDDIALILSQVTLPQSTNISGQQQSNFVIIRGNSYSATSRDLAFTKLSNVEWPTDISIGWTWTLWSERHGSNGNSGADTITGTVTVVTATGDSRKLRLAITATNSALLAEGLYKYALRGTNGSGEVWDVVKGIITVED